MKYKITGQMPLGLSGKHPNQFIRFIDVNTIIEAKDEYEALEKAPSPGPELYLCRDLVIQPLSPHAHCQPNIYNLNKISSVAAIN